MYFPYIGEILDFQSLWDMHNDGNFSDQQKEKLNEKEKEKNRLDFKVEKERLELEWIMKSNNWDFFYPVYQILFFIYLPSRPN